MTQIIIDTYPIYGINTTLEKLGLSENEKYEVQHKASALKLKRTNKYYTESEIEFLKDNYSSMTIEDISLKMNKSKDSIIHRANDLGLKNDIYFYSDADVEFLYENYNNMTNEQLSKILNKTVSSITTKAFKLGLCNDQSWTDDEINILKEVYPHYTNKKISKDFLKNRNPTSISTMAHKFDLVKSDEKKIKWYNKEDMINDLRNVSSLIGKAPYESELESYGLPSGKSFDRYFGTYGNACIIAGFTPNASIYGKSSAMVASDGTKCASKSEYIVCEYLIKNHITYIKEAYYRDYTNDERCGRKRVDWVINNYFVEFFGLPEKVDYKKHMIEKEQICSDNNIKLISLFRNDLKKLDEKLHIFLQ